MPIEVRELVIKARVEDAPANTGSHHGSGTPQKGLNDRDIQKIVAMCAEEVMKVLKRQKER